MHRYGRERVRVRKEPIAKGRTAAWYPVPHMATVRFLYAMVAASARAW